MLLVDRIVRKVDELITETSGVRIISRTRKARILQTPCANSILFSTETRQALPKEVNSQWRIAEDRDVKAKIKLREPV